MKEEKVNCREEQDFWRRLKTVAMWEEREKGGERRERERNKRKRKRGKEKLKISIWLQLVGGLI